MSDMLHVSCRLGKTPNILHHTLELFVRGEDAFLTARNVSACLSEVLFTFSWHLFSVYKPACSAITTGACQHNAV